MQTSLDKTTEIEVDGIVVPETWDVKNQVVTIAINTSGEQAYLIDLSNQLGKELLNHLKKRILIKGNLTNSPNGDRAIIVKEYAIHDW